MPYKLRNNRRHKFEKTTFKITNWSDYNKVLINRGSVTLWLSPEIIKAWGPKKHKQKLQGGQFKYSDTAIQSVKPPSTIPVKSRNQSFAASHKLPRRLVA